MRKKNILWKLLDDGKYPKLRFVKSKSKGLIQADIREYAREINEWRKNILTEESS